MRTGQYGLLLAMGCMALSGCAGVFNGEPEFPHAGILPTDAQQLVANVSTGMGSVPAVAPPQICQGLIDFENQGLPANTTQSPAPAALAGAPSSPTSPSSSIQPAVTSQNYEAIRNDCINLYLGAIDYSYGEYKSALLRVADNSTFSLDVGAIATAGAAAAFGGTTGQILSGVASGLGALKTTINSDLLYKNSITSIISQMDTDRNKQLDVILKQMGVGSTSTTDGTSGTSDKSQPTKPKIISGTVNVHLTLALPPPSTGKQRTETINITRKVTTTNTPAPAMTPTKTQSTPTYTMHAAAVDLQGYFFAGTFAHAVVAMTQTTGTNATSCKNAVKNQKTGASNKIETAISDEMTTLGLSGTAATTTTSSTTSDSSSSTSLHSTGC